MAVQQVQPHDRFPSGDFRDLAEISLSPQEISACYGLVFADLFDDLDWFKLAAVALPGGAQAWLLKYKGDQYPGTLVRVDAAADLSLAKGQLQQAFGLTDADFRWVAPGLQVSVALS